ncbi:MAG: YCF48-related protein [Bacteroidota bacterium]|nr:YCF48-related protein [Bacteroidota bacterium]MDP4232845.1 YCF48-related protein [Bacteroidota bacterium]MDP4241889.1 YCF48-related protein [Bacteroidota bacterium]MDP4288214.1 YCF48-related protein [Bacteroidota bacterium]
MKHLIAVLSILTLAATARAQTQQQPDSVPPTQGWVQADTTGISFDPSYLIDLNTLPSIETARAGSVPMAWSINSNLLKWQPAPPPKGEPWFWSSSYGFILSNYTIRTTDAGRTWDTLGHGPQYTAPGCFAAPSTLFTCGSNFISRTTDSGTTWSEQQINSPDLNAISFSNAREGYAVGAVYLGSAACFQTTDGGDHWNRLEILAPYPLTGVFAIAGTREAVAVGYNGYVTRTRNGGASWDTIAKGLTKHDLRSVAFKGQYGIIVGEGPTILATSDWGETWVNQKPPTTSDLDRVVMYDSLHAVATGEKGTILVTANGGLSWVGPPPSQDSLSVQVFPNPASGQTQISYSLLKPQHVTLTIFDVSGVAVATVLNYSYQAGPETVPLNTSVLAAGTYFYRLQSEEYSTQGSFTVIH